jgi:hypothetical protein
LRQVYCPKNGILKFLLDDGEMTNWLRLASEEEPHKKSSAIDIQVDIELKECTLFPGSEVMIISIS